MLKAWILTLLIGAAVMALPAVALAQSAGDNQYQDPLGSSGSSGGGSNKSRPASGAANSGSNSGTAGKSASSAPASGTASSQGNQLPRTGLPAGVLALSGAALLGSGVALRRRVTPRTDQ